MLAISDTPLFLNRNRIFYIFPIFLFHLTYTHFDDTHVNAVSAKHLAFYNTILRYNINRMADPLSMLYHT